MNATAMKRVFKLEGIQNAPSTLEDPNPLFSETEVMKFYAGLYPDLTTAHVKGPEISEKALTYTISRSVGTKG